MIEVKRLSIRHQLEILSSLAPIFSSMNNSNSCCWW